MKLELRAVTKHFGSLAANENVDLIVEPGQIHGLLGENGAGKTTLMNVLYGMITPDSGQLLINDEVVDIRDPKDAVTHKIGMVHQHFMLIPVFTVADNIILGSEPSSRGHSSITAAPRNASSLLLRSTTSTSTPRPRSRISRSVNSNVSRSSRP